MNLSFKQKLVAPNLQMCLMHKAMAELQVEIENKVLGGA